MPQEYIHPDRKERDTISGRLFLVCAHVISLVGGFGMGILKIDTCSENGRTHIGKKTVFQGMISSSENLTIEGTVKGEVACHGTVVVEEGGMVDADIIAEEAFIKGQVDGNIKAQKRVEIASTGRVKGDIESSSLSIAEGVVFEGTCHMTGEKNDENNLPALSNTIGKGIIPAGS
jgi:cytoskeletal protein CcmA (bactofilin family)